MTPVVPPSVVPNPPPPTAPGSVPAATELLVDDAHQSWPAIYGDIVVWEDGRNGHLDIYARDLTSGQETRLTTDPGDERLPDIWGDKVVYESTRNGEPDVFVFDLTTGEETRLTSHPQADAKPRVSGNRVIFEAWRDDGPHVHMIDLTTGSERTLHQDLSDQPDIGERWAVWVAWGTGTQITELIAYDLVSGCRSQRTTGAKAQRPRVHGDLVVYENRSVSGEAPVDLFNLQTGRIHRLTPYRTIGLGIWGDFAVVADRRNDDLTTQVHEREIIAYRLSTREEIPLTWDTYPQILPSIWNGRVVWVGNESQDIDEDLDIYMVEIGTP